LENDIRGDVYQLTLPAQSIFGAVENGKMPLQAYAKFLGSHGLPVTAVVTEMRFDTASATPRLTFKAIRPLNEEELALAQLKGQSADAKAAIAATAAQMDGATKVSLPTEMGKMFDEDEAKAMAKVKAEAVEDTAEPTKRTKKAAPKDVADILDDWAE
jgi:hypothetical protein